MSDRRKEMHEQITAELARIAKLGPMLKGTVSEVNRGARKRGGGERTAHLLTYKGKGNKTKSVYVPARRVEEVQALVARHREATRILSRVVDLSVDLFKAKQKHASQGHQERLA